MKPFFVLIATFVVAATVLFFLHDSFDWKLSGRIALSAMLLFTSLGHFLFPTGMALMIPPFIPARKALVYFTGFIEIAAAIALLLHSTYKATSWFLIGFFILLLPANIYAASKRINYEKPDQPGPGISYLWFRIPFQLLLITWTILTGICQK